MTFLISGVIAAVVFIATAPLFSVPASLAASAAVSGVYYFANTRMENFRRNAQGAVPKRNAVRLYSAVSLGAAMLTGAAMMIIFTGAYGVLLPAKGNILVNGALLNGVALAYMGSGLGAFLQHMWNRKVQEALGMYDGPPTVLSPTSSSLPPTRAEGPARGDPRDPAVEAAAAREATPRAQIHYDLRAFRPPSEVAAASEQVTTRGGDCR